MSPSTTKNFFKTACYFEGSLIVIAVIIGWLTEINPFWNIYFSEEAIFYGIIGTFPLILLFSISEQLPFKSFKKIKYLLEESLAKDLYNYHWADLFILAVIAGVSEEVLFRGALQPWLEQSLGLNEGLVVSSLIFGLVHAVTPLYAVLASLISFYLGLTLDYGETRNLLTPIIIHSLYDFFAFIVLIRNYRKKNSL